MRLEFVKAFVEITEKVFFEVLDSKTIAGNPSLESSTRIEGSVVTSVDLSGSVLGKILLYMDISTAEAVAERMMGRRVSERRLVASCVAELTSVAVGQAVSWINDRAFHIRIGPPFVTLEAQFNPPQTELETVVFPLKTVCGDAIINISFVDLDYGADENEKDV